MKLITTKKIDTVTVITNVSSTVGLVDGEATRKIVEVEITKTPIAKQIDEIKKQMEVYAASARQAATGYKRAKTDEDQRKYADEYQLRKSQIDDLRKDLIPIVAEFHKQWQALMIEKAVYFTPASGDELISDTEGAEVDTLLKQAFDAGQLLTRDKTTVTDNRGKTFWKKTGSEWAKFPMTKITDAQPSGSFDETQLTDAQRAEIAGQVERIRARVAPRPFGQPCQTRAQAVGAAERGATGKRKSAPDRSRGQLTNQGGCAHDPARSGTDSGTERTARSFAIRQAAHRRRPEKSCCG
jgi:hypothetical protein